MEGICFVDLLPCNFNLIGPASSIKQQIACEMKIHIPFRTHPQPFDPQLRKKKKFKNKKEFVPEISVYSREKVWLHDSVWLERNEKMKNKFNEAGAWQGDELCRGKQLRVREINFQRMNKKIFTKLLIIYF